MGWLDRVSDVFRRSAGWRCCGLGPYRHEDGTVLVWDPSTVVLRLLAKCNPRALFTEVLQQQGVAPPESASTGSPAVLTAIELDADTGSLLVAYSDGLVLFLERQSILAAEAKALPPTPGQAAASAAAGTGDVPGPTPPVGRRVATGKFIRVFGPAHPKEYWNVAISSTLHKGPVNAVVLCEPWRMWVASLRDVCARSDAL